MNLTPHRRNTYAVPLWSAKSNWSCPAGIVNEARMAVNIANPALLLRLPIAIYSGNVRPMFISEWSPVRDGSSTCMLLFCVGRLNFGSPSVRQGPELASGVVVWESTRGCNNDLRVDIRAASYCASSRLRASTLLGSWKRKESPGSMTRISDFN